MRNKIFPDIPDTVFYSPYIRTIQTMEGMLAAYPSDRRDESTCRCPDIQLRERDPGYGFSMTKEESKKYFPYLQDHWNKAGPLLARPPGGESVADMLPRVQIATSSISDQLFEEVDKEENKLLVVTHGRTLLCIRYFMEGWDPGHMDTLLRNGETPGNCAGVLYRASRNSHGEIVLEIEEVDLLDIN